MPTVRSKFFCRGWALERGRAGFPTLQARRRASRLQAGIIDGMRWPSTPLTERLGIRLPIVQAPMSGSDTAALAAAVSNAGGLGSIGAARLGPDELRAAIRDVRALTDRPFNINLFAWPEPTAPSADAVRALDQLLAPHRRRLGLPDADAAAAAPGPPPLAGLVEQQIEVVCEEGVPVFSFTFGIPALGDIKAAGAVTMGTATSTDEAVALEQAGVDIVVAQSAEAGGHRGTFLHAFHEAIIGGFALIPQVVDRVKVPVVAAGGIMDGRGIVAALALGAGGAQLGTAFLATHESAAAAMHKHALAKCRDTDTRVTSVYTGRAARAIRTSFIEELEASPAPVLDFPIQAAHTTEINAAARDQVVEELMLMLAGQAAAMSRRVPAAELVSALVSEVQALLST